MNNTTTSQNLAHPEDYWKDEWVLSRKSIHAGGLTIDRHLKLADEIDAGYTNHHIIGYSLGNSGNRQIIRLDGKEYSGMSQRGNIWLKPSQTPGFWQWENTNEALIFTIKPNFLRQIALENNCPHSDRLEILPVVQARDSQLDILTIQFKQELENTEYGNQMYIESLANIFLIYLLRNYCSFPTNFPECTEGLPTYKLRKALDYINDNLDQSIKLNDIAQLLDISQYYFCHLFKQSTGVAPYKYVIQQRVAKAKELIKQEKISLAEIALECGFSSQSQMTQHFRKCVGVTPKAYRNR